MKKIIKILSAFMFFTILNACGNVSSASVDFSAEITAGAKNEYKVNSVFSVGGTKKVETGTGNTVVREEETFNATSSWHFFARSGSLTYLHQCSPGGADCANTECTTSGKADSNNKNAGIDYALSKLDDLKGNAIYNLRTKAEKAGYILDEDSIYKIGNGAKVHYFACDNGYNDAVVRLRVYGKGYREVSSKQAVTKLSTISLTANGFNVDKTSIDESNEYTWSLNDIKITSLDYDYLMKHYNPNTNTFDGKIVVTSTFDGVETTKEITIPFPAYLLTINVAPENSGQVSLDSGNTYVDMINEKFPIGYVVNGVTAKPNDGFSFTNWTENNTPIEVLSGISMNNNRTIYANFNKLKNYYTLTLEINNSAAGILQMEMDNEWKATSQETFEEGSVVNIRTISKDNNRYIFRNWTENGTEIDVTSGIEMNSNRVIKANYEDLGEYYDEYRHTCQFGDINKNYNHNLSISMAPNKGETGFLPGEIINYFTGSACSYTKTGSVGCTNHVQTKYRVFKNGIETLLETNSNYNCTKTEPINESGYLDVKLKFDGIKLSFNGARVDDIFLAVNSETGEWTTKDHYLTGFKVESFDRLYYDSVVGKHYGKVKVFSNGDECVSELKIYVGNPPAVCTLTVYPSDAVYASSNNQSNNKNSVTVSFGEPAFYGFKNNTISSKYTGKFKEIGTDVIYELNNTSTSGIINSMTRDITLVAVEKNELTVDISPREGGKLYVNGSTFTPGSSIYLAGNDIVHIKAEANFGFTVGNWMDENTGSIYDKLGNIVESGTVEFDYKMPNDNSNHTVIACVENVTEPTVPYKVTYKVEPSNAGSMPSPSMHYVGETISLSIDINDGWTFDTRAGYAWQFYKDTGNGEVVEVNNVTDKLLENKNTYYDVNGNGQFIMPSYDIIAVSHYIHLPDSKSLTVYIYGEGTVTVDGNTVISGQTINTINDIVNVVATPNEGHKFLKAVNGDATWVIYSIQDNEFNYELVKAEESIYIYFSGDIEELGHDVTFEAEPLEGGTIPNDLENVLPGENVYVPVIPNKGWEFDYWYFKYADGVIVPDSLMPIIKYDSSGAEYFIMPDYDITAVAVFKEVTTYKLYVSYMIGGIAWTYGDNNSKVNYIEAIPGESYTIEFKSDVGFIFDGWEYKYKVVDGDKYPGINEKAEHNLSFDSDILVMPHSDITVTAKFKEKNPDITSNPKLKVTSNNYYWGTAWLELDDNSRVDWEPESGFLSNAREGVTVEAGKSYTIKFEAKNGYEFSEWIPQDRLTNWYVSDDLKTGWAVLTMPDYDYEIMTYFEPNGEGVRGYTLTVIADPDEGGTVTGGGSNIIAGTTRRISATASKNYEFKYWYKLDKNGNKIKLPFDRIQNYEMPEEDVTLYAKFKKDSNLAYYELDIKVEGTGTVIANIGGEEVFITKEYSKRVLEGTRVTLNISNYNTFNGWEVNNISKGNNVPLEFSMNQNKYVVASFLTSSYQLNITVKGNGNVSGTVRKDGSLIDSIYVTDTYTVMIDEGAEVILYPINNGQKFSGWKVNNSAFGKDALKLIMNENKNVIASFDGNSVTTDFNIVSVRDLRWKDDFIKLGASDLSGLTFGVPNTDEVMLNSGSDKDKVKMGYAVEFELNTIAVPSGDASLDIDVTLLDANGDKISWDKVYDGLTGEKIDDRFKAFSINGKNEIFQGEEIPMLFTNNGININLIKWRWVYYLPAKIDIVPATGLNVDDNITVAFSIKLKSGDTVVNDYVKHESYLNSYGWNGKTFSYSMRDSLLDDIYDNAQN